MSELIIYKWSLWCVTDQKIEYVWSDIEPHVCPTDHTHEIDQETVSIIDQMTQNVVKIKEESIVTGGNFKCETRKITISANSTNHMDTSFKYPVSVYNFTFRTKDQNEGDLIEMHIAPNTLVGIFTTDTLIGNNILTVSNTAINVLMIGYHVSTIIEGNSIDLGTIININKNTNQITLSQNLAQDITNGLPILMTIKVIENYEIGPAGAYVIGEGKIGGFSIPANTLIRVVYTNLTAVEKSAIAKFEYSY